LRIPFIAEPAGQGAIQLTITRKRFLGAAAGGTVLLLLQACGGGGYGASEPASDSTRDCGSSGATISGNHGHALTIATADLDSKVDKTYSILGLSDHDHAVTFTPAQLQMLKASQSVTVTSSRANEHNHEVSATCI
jgi:hypothetical protein